MSNSNKKILIVEDEEDLREMYSSKISSAGYNVITATCGDEGLTAIKKEKPDLVLLDLIMPRKNGFDVMEELKNDKNKIETPIIILSNLCQDEDMELAKEMGAIDYLIKSQIKLDDLVIRINQYFK